jgi:hypothetical protein
MRTVSKCVVLSAAVALLSALSLIVNSLRHGSTANVKNARGSVFERKPSGHLAPAVHAGHDRNLPFDPVLAYSTFLGGPQASGPSGFVSGQGATVLLVDGSGNTYLAGVTNSASFPVTPGAVFSANPQAYSLGFLSKFDPMGQSLLFSTYVAGIDQISAMALDSSGNIFVAGPAATPASLPVPPGTIPFQASPKSNNNIGILKLNSTGTAVLNATYLGGSSIDFAQSIAVDSLGDLYVAGNTLSNDFPTTPNALQTTFNSIAQNGSMATNVFVTKLNPTLSALAYSTYLGQTSVVNVGASQHSLAVDSSGNAYLTGSATTGFPTTSGALQAGGGFLAKLNAGGSALLYSTYLPPTGVGNTVVVDSSNNAYVGGVTSAGFPEIHAVQSCSTTGAFLAEFDTSGTLKFSTCLGSENTNGVVDLAVDSSGNLYVAGNSDISLPLKNPIQSKQTGQFGGPFVAAISANANPPALLFSSFIGGTQPTEVDIISAVGVDSGGNIYAAGSAGTGSQTPSPFPVFNAFQPIPAIGTICSRSNCSSTNAFLMKISPTDAPAAALTPALLGFPAQQVGTPSASQPVTVVDLGSAALTVSDATATGDFSLQNNCATVSPAGGTCAIQVTFTPTATGTRTGTLTITDNSAGSPRTVELTGQGAVTAATVAPSSLTFASQLVGTTSSAQTITVTNPGPLGLQISHVQASGDFSETNNCGTALTPGANCTVSVTFTPTATGNRTDNLTITDNAPDSPQTVALSGTGENPSLGLSIASGSSSSAKVTAGSSATYSLSIGGGGISGTASLSCTGAPTGALCSVPATEQVSASTASNFTASLTTTAPGQVAVRPRGFGNTPWVWACALFGFIFLPRITQRCTVLRVVCFMPLIVVMLCSCGGGGSQTPPESSGTPAGTYTLTVTATTSQATQTQNLTLVVQ